MEQSLEETWTGLAPDALRRFREDVGLTQRAFAGQLGVTPITVHRWETGQSRPHRLARVRLREIREQHVARADIRHSLAGAVDSPAILDLAGNPEGVSVYAEALRLIYGHQFNRTFATETSRIDPLPHQRIAVYEHMLTQNPLRFLLADDAGAGKTIMTGLTIREMLARRRVRRVLIIPPAGLVGNWERELRELFQLSFRIVTSSDHRDGNPFQGLHSDRVIVSLDTMRGPQVFGWLRDAGTPPYELVVFDEAHKLAASKQNDRVHKTLRYQLAESLAGCPAAGNRFRDLPWSARHLLLLTATPHMGKDSPYYFLWRLLAPEFLGTEEAFRRLPAHIRTRHFIRRTKEEMVDIEGNPLYPQRECLTFTYDLSRRGDGEQDLYDRTTAYLQDTYGRALTNRPAVQLAMSVFQRRLASSTWALLRSFERRLEKLRRIVEDLQSGKMSAADIQRCQGQIHRTHGEDFFDTHGADDDMPESGGEGNEEYEDAVLGAVVSITIDELNREIETLNDLSTQARRLLASGCESKFEKLREVLEDGRFAAEKCLIFTEHRDTCDYLVRRLEALGFSDQVGQIHGGMDWREREQQVDAFRSPSGTRYLVATDAAGEGINLQFCRLMLNYDIPWNPARLEQRMGRIHRYGQKHDVQIINLVAGGTYEGRVLQVLLEKLESIRTELRSDKVFDVIGRLFENVSLRQHMLHVRDEEGERSAIDRINRSLAVERVRGIAEDEQRVYGQGGDVANRLCGLRIEADLESYAQLLPAFVRRLVEKAASLLDFQIRGDSDSVFSLSPKRLGALDWSLSALEAYPTEMRERFSTRRPAGDSSFIWLRPGEPVFDALIEQVKNEFGRDALRGCIWVDPRAEAPCFFHLVEITVEETTDEHAPETSPTDDTDSRTRIVERQLVGLVQASDGTTSECDIERLLLLHAGNRIPPGSVPFAGQALGMCTEAALYAERSVLGRILKERNDAMGEQLPQRKRQLNIDFDLREAELARQRIKAASRRDRDEAEYGAIKRDQRELAVKREIALRALEVATNRGAVGRIRFLLHAIGVPPSPHDTIEKHDERVEEQAVLIAVAWEQARGATVTDVSKPELARSVGLPSWPGFDLLAVHPQAETRNIEVKGRASRGSIQMEENEWNQACHLGDRYWLYAVLDCATADPLLVRVQNPFKKLLARPQGSSAHAISVGQLLEIVNEAE